MSQQNKLVCSDATAGWTPRLSSLTWSRRSPGQLGGRLLPRLEPLLVGLQLQDVLLLQLPLGRTVAQLDGQRVLPQHLQGQSALEKHSGETPGCLLRGSAGGGGGADGPNNKHPSLEPGLWTSGRWESTCFLTSHRVKNRFHQLVLLNFSKTSLFHF